MKIAYLISGHPKTYQECIDTFINNVSGNSTEVYSHFWWDNSYQNKCYKQHFSEKYESLDLDKKIIEDFKIKDFIIDKDESFDLTFFKKFNKDVWGDNSEKFYRILTPIVIYGLLSQTYSINKAYSLSKGNEYDVVIKSRPDLILTKDLIKIIEDLDLSDNNIYFQSSLKGGHLYAGEDPNRPCDWFFIANQKTMGIFLSEWHNSISDKFTHGIIHANELIRSVAESNNMNVHLIDFGAHIYKNSTDHYYKYHNNIEIYLDDFDIDLNKPKTSSIWPYWIDKVDFDHFKKMEF